MKLQPASKREVTRITLGTLALDGILIAGLFLLSQFDIGTFQLIPILLGTAVGSIIAVMNFIIMCLTVQSAVGMTDQKKMKAKFQLSYNTRMVIQAGWVVAAFLLRPRIHFLAAAIPVLFPKVTILYLQARGKLIPKEETAKAAEHAPSDEA